MSHVALSPHEPLAERLDALRETRDGKVARLLCEDEVCPAELRVEALLMLDGTEVRDQVLALASCIPTLPPNVQEIARQVVKQLLNDECVFQVEAEILSEPSRTTLAAVWGLGELIVGHDLEIPRNDVKVEVADRLATIAGLDFLASSITKSELMGSIRTEALAALSLRALGSVVESKWYIQNSRDFYGNEFRGAALFTMIRDNAKRVNATQISSAILTAIAKVVEEEAILRDWNMSWYYGVSPDDDSKAREVVTASFAFARKAVHLLNAINVVLDHVTTLPHDLAADLFLFFSSWRATSADKGIVLPWNTLECKSVAETCFFKLSKRFSAPINVESIRTQLSGEKWKSAWFVTGGFVYTCIDSCESLENAELHLLPTLLPLCDEYDPRIAGPAWRAVNQCLQLVPNQMRPVLFKAIERALTTRDLEIFEQLMICLSKAVCESENSSSGDLEMFIERLARDCVYLASSETEDLYNLAIEGFLRKAINSNGLYSVPLLSSLLAAVEAGTQKRKTSFASLGMLSAIIGACRPRVDAHRGVILRLLVQLSVALPIDGDVELRKTFQAFLASTRHLDWIDECLDQAQAYSSSISRLR